MASWKSKDSPMMFVREKNAVRKPKTAIDLDLAISILTPSLNSGSHVTDAIDSVRTQYYPGGWSISSSALA